MQEPLFPPPPSSPPSATSLLFFIVFLSAALFLWRASEGRKPGTVATVHVAPKKLTYPDTEHEDLTKKKVSVFYGTQTGTAEGFAKVCYMFVIHLERLVFPYICFFTHSSFFNPYEQCAL